MQAIYDERPIAELTLSGTYDYWSVGRLAVTLITPYLEVDQTCWFAIYEGDHLASRVPASAVQHIWYGKGEN